MPDSDGRMALLYHFCRLQLPAVSLPEEACARHLHRTFQLHTSKPSAPPTPPTRSASSGPNSHSLDAYLDNLYPLDWFVASACLEGNERAWEYLFASRAGRTDCLLMDALRARAARLYPRDEERQESAVSEFWSHLYVPETPGSVPVLARYDGQRPLVPWLIRVFQNWHISQLRRKGSTQALPEDDLSLPLPAEADGRWHELFCQAAQEWLNNLEDTELLILGLRLRYRLSQREVAGMLGIHEGTISRRTDALRDECLAFVGKRLVQEGWTGDDLSEFIRTEMAGLLLDDSRLSADYLAKMLGQRKNHKHRLA